MVTNEFYINQEDNDKQLYIDLLEVTGSLSNLFSESTNPFLYYRAMENVFCKAFSAKNLSRGDISADARKDKIGIGLKTFLQNNGNTFQKIAEFNKESYLLIGLQPLELVTKVAQMRNERILSTMRICKVDDMIYHLVTRSSGYMAIFEEHMDLVNIDSIKVTNVGKSSVHFNDGIHDYNFNISKSTLLKRFNTCEEKKVFGFSVEILEDPFEFLLNLKNDKKITELSLEEQNDIIDYIVLPLYSIRTGKVEKSSGLNQWNAKGRPRNEDEVYISVPAWIHRNKVDFFEHNTDDYKTEPFEVTLPNGDIISMRIAQQGGKALMSNPNSALGNWILREILQLKPRELVTKEKLDIIGIDSVKLSKKKDGEYFLDFLKLGSYEEFEEEFKKD